MRIKSEEKLEKEENFQTTDYVYSHRGDVLLEDTGSSDGRTSYVYAFEKTFARVDGTVTPGEEMEITYFHHDTTDSTRLMTDADGEVTMDQDYLPFGGDLPGAGKDAVVNEDAESYKYTGQKEVVSIGLYYYGARYYDSGTGRFTTRDSYRGEPENSQSLNMFVYVQNNPLRYTDPTGYSPESTKPTHSYYLQQYNFDENQDSNFATISSYDSNVPTLRDYLMVDLPYDVSLGNPNKFDFHLNSLII